MSTIDYYSVLRIRAFNDLTNRAKPGIVMYSVIWFAIALSLGINKTNPEFFQINSVIIILFFLIRCGHLLVRNKVTIENVGLFEGVLVGSILLGALHWGIMSALIFYDEPEELTLVVLAAFAMGGTSSLSISHQIRVYYPGLLLVPSMVVFLWEGSPTLMLYAGLLLISWIYIFVASKSAEQDYWQAVSNSLIAEERASEMEKLSITDPLTQIFNRMHFDNEYEKEWLRCARLKSYISVLMIDLDNFKNLNDTYGHVFGDEVLQSVAACLKDNVLRPGDCVARYGGEEFIVLLPNTNREGIQCVASRIVSSVATLQFQSDGKTVPVTCSVGGAAARPHPGDERADLVKRADRALYDAKENGRNQFVICDEVLPDEVARIGT